METDVAIVGGGPVGLTLANLLGEYGVRCVLLEQNPGASTHPRAQTIDDESLRTIQTFGCADRFTPLTKPAAGSNYYDEHGERFGHVGVGPSNYGFFKRNYMLQQQLDALLLDNLSNYDSVTQRFSTRMTSFEQLNNGSVKLNLANQGTLTSRFMIGCDGGSSEIRRALGVQMKGWTYEQDWIVLDMLDDPDTELVSRFFCNPVRPCVSIASPGNGRRYEFMLLPGETRDDVLSDQHLTELLKPFRRFDASKVTRRAVYTFHARIADKLRVGNVMLLGDAAHLTPPFAGQGLNAGVRDAQNLAWKLALVCNKGTSAASLDSYENERRGPIWAMIQIAVAMGEFVMPVGDEQVAVKRSVLNALERFPQAREWLFQMRFKPKPRYDQGLFVALDAQLFEASLVGEMLPQPTVRLANGNTALLDDVMGSGFCLLAQSHVFDSLAQRLTHPVWGTLDPTRLQLSWEDSCGDERNGDQKAAPSLSDKHHCAGVTQVTIVASGAGIAGADNVQYARPLRTHRDQILLVRPDRYVAGAFFASEVDHFSEQLATIIGLTNDSQQATQ